MNPIDYPGFDKLTAKPATLEEACEQAARLQQYHGQEVGVLNRCGAGYVFYMTAPKGCEGASGSRYFERSNAADVHEQFRLWDRKESDRQRDDDEVRFGVQ